MRRSAAWGTWVTVAVLSVVTLVLYVDNKRTRECIADYMVADQRNATERVVLIDQERLAFLVTMQTVFDPNVKPEPKKQAGDNYIALVLKNNEIRKANPILPVPTECN